MFFLRLTLSRNISVLPYYMVKSNSMKYNTAIHSLGKKYDYGTVATSVVSNTYGDIVIPNQSVTELVFSQVDQRPNASAVTCGVSGRSYTYGTIRNLIRRCASAFLGKVGLKPGDRIGLVLPNIPEYVIAIHAGMAAGLTVTFANPLYTEQEIFRQFQSAEVKCIVTIPDFLNTVLNVAKKLPNYTQTINIGGATDPNQNILAIEALLSEELDVEFPELKPTDVAILPFSSGTTGVPKGVMLTHRNIVANLIQNNHPEFNGDPIAEIQQNAYTVLPFFHIYGFNSIMNMSLYRGEHMITLPRFTPEDYISGLIKYRPEVLFLVPSLLLFLASHPAVKTEHLSSVKRIICGAAPAGKNLIDKFTEKLGHDDYLFTQGYGMTETSPVTISSPLKMKQDKWGSSGRLMPSTHARLIDLADGKDITVPLKSGELLIKGPQIMKGYLNNDEATAEIIDKEGWLHTGDVAYYDDDEYFYIVDRTKELIKVKGNQVSPTELESIILEIPGVADVGVIGIPDTSAGELPRAFVVKKPDSDLTEESISDYLKPKVAAYKRLAGGVIFIDALPRNASGKMLRHELKNFGK